MNKKSVFSSLKEFSKGVTGGTAGVAKKSSLPFDVQMKPPNFCLGAIWQLAHGSKNNVPSPELGIEYTFYFKAEPLIALVWTIDLLDLAVQAAGTLVGGPAGNKTAKVILEIIREWAAKDEDLGITFKILFDLILTGQIDGSADMDINTASDDNKGNAKLETKLSAEIKLEVELKAKAVILEVTAYAAGSAKASAKASVTFGHSLKYNQNTKSLYYRPEIKFDAVKGRVLIKVEAGLSAKKLDLDYKKNKVVVDDNYEFWRGFDVIECLERTTNINANINLL